MPLKKEPVSRAFSVPRWQQVYEKTNVRFEVQRDSGFIRKTTISLSSLPQSPRPFSGSKTRRNLFPSRLIRPSDGQCRVTDEGWTEIPSHNRLSIFPPLKDSFLDGKIQITNKIYPDRIPRTFSSFELGPVSPL